MLKIKDNVDLKKLKSFGYYYEEDYRGNKYIKNINDGILKKVIIDENSREIGLMCSYLTINQLYIENYTQDLIKSGLVEMVGE